MNIEELKKQEDLKTILGDLLNKIELKNEEKIKRFVKAAESDFERFFSEKEFSVQKEKYRITAKYGRLTAELKHDEKSGGYMGSHYVFDLLTTLPDKVEYTVSLHSGKPGVVITRRGPNPEEQLLQDIETQRARLENIENEAWTYMLKNQTGFTAAKNAAEAPPVFGSMYEALASIVM